MRSFIFSLLCAPIFLEQMTTTKQRKHWKCS